MRGRILRVVVGLMVASAASARAGAPAPGLTLAAGADGGLELRAGAAVVARIPVKTSPLRRAVPSGISSTYSGVAMRPPPLSIARAPADSRRSS